MNAVRPIPSKLFMLGHREYRVLTIQMLEKLVDAPVLLPGIGFKLVLKEFGRIVELKPAMVKLRLTHPQTKNSCLLSVRMKSSERGLQFHGFQLLDPLSSAAIRSGRSGRYIPYLNHSKPYVTHPPTSCVHKPYLRHHPSQHRRLAAAQADRTRRCPRETAWVVEAPPPGSAAAAENTMLPSHENYLTWVCAKP